MLKERLRIDHEDGERISLWYNNENRMYYVYYDYWDGTDLHVCKKYKRFRNAWNYFGVLAAKLNPSLSFIMDQNSIHLEEAFLDKALK